MQHLLIADAGPLIALARIQQLVLLRQLFRTVTITAGVAGELGCGLPAAEQAQLPGTAALLEALEAGWIVISDFEASAADQPLNPGVDAGEASAIGLALRLQAAGEQVLLLAKEQQLIAACAPLLSAMREHGYYLSDDLLQAVLDQVAEG